MANYILTNKAVEDLSQTWNYTYDVWSEKQADKYYKILLDYCQDLANNPNLGKNYTEIAEDLFGYKANHHIIFYRKQTNKNIEITRILHSRMDLKNRIAE